MSQMNDQVQHILKLQSETQSDATQQLQQILDQQKKDAEKYAREQQEAVKQMAEQQEQAAKLAAEEASKLLSQ